MPEKPEPQIEERLPQFRRMAAEAKSAALAATNPELREAYENLARSWDQLIMEIAARKNA